MFSVRFDKNWWVAGAFCALAMNINTALGIEVTDEKLEELSQKWQQIKEEMKGINPEDMKPVLRAMGLCYDKEVEAFGDALIISTFAEVCFGLDAGQFLPENRIKLFNILNVSPEIFADCVRKSHEEFWCFSSNKTYQLRLRDENSSVIFPVAMLLEHFCPLGSIALRGIHMGDAEVNTLSYALKVNSSLTELTLCSNNIGASGADSLSEALKVNSSLTELTLCSNNIGASGADSLSEALKVNSSLTGLSLFGNNIGDSGATSLSKALKVNSSLTVLNLGYNHIGASGAISLSGALKVNQSLPVLDLHSNHIGDSGAGSLSEALKVNSSLTELDASYNHIGDSGKKALGDALYGNCTITRLDSEPQD